MKINRNISQEEWNALAEKYFGNCNEEEMKAFEDQLKSLGEADLAEIEKIAEQVNLHYKLGRYDSNKAFLQVMPKIKRRNVKLIPTLKNAYFLRAAAVVLMVVMIGSVWYFAGSGSSENLSSSAVSVDDHGISIVELPDGSLVSLNRDSKINYPDQFSGDRREVSIEGEAFFEVEPNPQKPFIIHAGDASIEVLGTSFNVDAYPDNENVEVVVRTGKVQVYEEKSSHSAMRKLVLDPGDKGVFVQASKELLKIPNKNPNYLAWKTRHLIFKETSLKEVITQLNKLYRVQIKIDSKNTEELNYTGHFENESVDFILEVVSQTLQIELSKDKQGYLLKKRT